MKHLRARITLLLGTMLLLPALAAAASGEEILQSQCASCHALAKPSDASLDRLWTRKGPDLWYAGVKFNKDWLVQWLQAPTVIRPAGVMYRKAVKAAGGGAPDVIDASQVPAHMKLGAADAAAAADALLALGTDAGLVQKGAFKQDPPNVAMASLLFNKLRGCSSCHAAKAGGPPHSGPELYSAGARLQPDYVVEYIRDPQKFDPHIWMPKLELTDADIQKLTGFLMTLKQAGAQ
ncbi:MAG TPA: cytochrome c [Steroidobacteraceae bacterium]|nr:cytochrome c [Steroidobacteraceae bacterium]